MIKRRDFMKYKKGDFHIHSINSDGSFEVEDIIDMYFKNGYDIIALTDHDTVAGCKEAVEYGRTREIRVVPGIELSTKYNRENVHILGYFNNDDYMNSDLISFTDNMRIRREKRCIDICKNLERYFNIKIDPEKILRESEGSVGRPHIAKAIIESGYAEDFNYVFEKYIGDDSPAYIPSSDLTPQEGVDLLKSCNAVTVLAHPVHIKKSKVCDLIEMFEFDGIEAIYYDNTDDDTRKFKAIANHYNLLITAGNDFHDLKDRGKKGFGKVSLDKENIEKLLEKIDGK